MTKEQIKEHILEYIELNANEKTALEVANEIINQLSNMMCESGYISTSNQLTTCYLIIKEILENDSL